MVRDGGRALGDPLLPAVVREASAAVLVVDLDRGAVTFVNDLARQLAPDVALPTPLAQWSQAAGLEDVGGAALPVEAGDPVDTVDPGTVPIDTAATSAQSLLRVAQGEPLTGEAVTAARDTSASARREVLWVVGFPLADAPESLRGSSLVVFLPARQVQLLSETQESAVNLRERAMLATRVSFTISDPRRPDNPLVWVNPAFTETTGYSAEEVIGRNCRFLQGPGTDPRTVAQIRDFIGVEAAFTTTLLNYRKNGSAFWNELSISPVRDHDAVVTHFVGVQADVTARVEAQMARDQAMTEVAIAADRLALLADFTSRLALCQRPQDVVELLAEVVVPAIGTWAVIFPVDEFGQPEEPLVRHDRESDPDVAKKLAALRGLVPAQLAPGSPVWRVLRGAEPFVLIDDYDTAPPEVSGAAADERTDLIHELGLRGVITVPLLARGAILGCVAVVADDTAPRLGDSEVALVRDLAVRAALMLENTQLHARDRHVAETLQLSLLPRVVAPAGITVATSYVPALDEAAVGGDWYDVFELHGGGTDHRGRAGVVVGDVMGHNIESAARMGKLSTILRAYGWPGSPPAEVLGAVDELLAGSTLDVLATCWYATLTPQPGGMLVEYASAGHPPALVRTPDGRVSTLDGGRGPMLGISTLRRGGSARPPDARVDLGRGNTVVCFTDGLVDAFSDEGDFDTGLARLSDLVARQDIDAPPQQIVDALTEYGRRKDDLAVVAIRID